MISECLCLPEAVEVSKEVVNGSSCIVPGVSGKQVENREGTVKNRVITCSFFAQFLFG